MFCDEFVGHMPKMRGTEREKVKKAPTLSIICHTELVTAEIHFTVQFSHETDSKSDDIKERAS